MRKANAEPSGGGGGGWAAMNQKLAESRARKQAGLSYGTQDWVQRKIEAGEIEGGMASGHSGTSIFDPVLTELVYRWFCPPGGLVLDPFAGGSVRGIVASRLGRRYLGVELRAEQVEANRQQQAIAGELVPEWRQGDSREIATICEGAEADLIFSCPPYADLEVYSHEEGDISNMDYPDFREAYWQIIERSCALLKPDRFAVFVVGDARGSDGFYYGIPEDTVEGFRRAGLGKYNEAILVTAVGFLPIRAAKMFERSRKLGKTHQNVLIFCKGDPVRATAAIGPVEFDVSLDGEADDPAADAEAPAEPVVSDPAAETPVQRVGDFWLKRDDLFEVAGVPGGKVRTCLALAEGASGLVTAGSRASPQVNIVAHIGQALGLPVRAHTPAGELSPEVKAAQEAGAEIVQHKAGYNNVIIARAREDAAARGWREIPFGMECTEAVDQTRRQVSNLPAEAKRLVVPVGSGMSLAGILWGLKDRGLELPVVGVVVGADPEKRLDKFAPPDWRERARLVPADVDYHKAVTAEVGGVALDPHYEAKCVGLLEPGDCLWVVGIRQSARAPRPPRAAPSDDDAEGWTYGVEAEMSDFDRRRVHPLDRCYITSEVGSVNSDGSACWWENPLGGEVNTYPTESPEEQAQIFAGFLALYPDATVNYRSTTHAHIRVPGLRGDRDSLLAAFRYSQRWTPWVIERVYRIERTADFQREDKGGRNWRYIHVGTVMPPDWRARQIEAAESAEDFFHRHMLNKAGEYRPLQATRYAVNFLMLKKHNTVEFRHFLGSDEPIHVQTVCEYAREFMRAALTTGEPMPSIFERMPHWRFPPPQRTDAALERGYRASEKKGDRSTPKFVLMGTKKGAGSASREWREPASG